MDFNDLDDDADQRTTQPQQQQKLQPVGAGKGSTPIPRSVRRSEPILGAGSSFMFIIGHVGSASAGVKLSSKQQSTHIGFSANPGEALRQFNNTQRGTRPAIICVCIFVPGWRRLAVRELVQLWHRSRKLACRMRFGITMAYDLSLPCFVAPLALTGDAARRALPYVVARFDAAQNETKPDEAPTANDADNGDRKWRSAKLRRSSSSSRGHQTRRRGRRPSAYETCVTDQIVFGDLSADGIMQTVAPHVNEQAPTTVEEHTLDRLNTMTYNTLNICFTIGKHGDVARRTTEAAKRPSKAKASTSTTATRKSASKTAIDDDDDDDNEEASEADNDEDDDDEEEETANTEPTHVPTRVRAKRKRLELADDELALAPLRQRNEQEIAVYQRTASNESTTSATPSPPSTSTGTIVSAAEKIAQECSVDGAFDNRTLVERADDCFTDANEYIARPLKRVHIDRAQHCVCGARDSFIGGVCNECRRSTASVRVVRTNVAAMRARATKQPCSADDRREISRLVVNAERETPIDAYIRSTSEQLREALTQQQMAFRPKATSSPQRTRAPKEMRFISAVLTRVAEGK